MKEYTEMDYYMDKDLLSKFMTKFEKSMKNVIPTLQMYNDEKGDSDYIVRPSQMYTVRMNKDPFIRARDKARISNLCGYIFISTEINPNGIDDSGRIGRTWTIHLKVSGTIRFYRHRIIIEGGVFNIYEYAESEQEVIDKFITEFKSLKDGDILSRIE